MTINVTFTFPNTEDALAFLNQARALAIEPAAETLGRLGRPPRNSAQPAVAQVTPAAGAADSFPPAQAVGASPASDLAVAETAPVVDAPVDPAPISNVTLDDVREKLANLHKRLGENGIQAVKAVLANVGAKKVSDIPADKYADVLELIKRAK